MYVRMNFTRVLIALKCFQRQCRDIYRRLMNLRANRDSVQVEANDNVLVETSGLDEALKVCLCYTMHMPLFC